MAGTLPPILVELKASSSEFMAKMGAARAEVTKLGTGSAANLKKFAAVGKAALLGVAGAAVIIGTVSVDMAAHFQSSMELIRTQAGASQAEVDKMSKAVLGLAGKTATAPEELAKGLYHLESSGLRGAKALDALKYAAEGAKVGHADLESVTNALNAVIASGIKGAHNMSGAMGALNATVGAGDMRMQDLADAMGTGVLTVAKNFGVSLNDVGAALAVFGDNNIRGADAATKLSQAITYMEKPAASAGKVFKTFGMTTKELRTDIGKGGLGLALKDLHDHLERAGITGTKVGPVLLDAFGRKPAGAINTLLGQFQRFQSKQEEVRRGAKGFGGDWAATTKTFSFQVEQLKTQVEVLAVKIGTALIPIIRQLATDVMNVVQWFEKHAEVAKILGVAIGSVLVVAITAYVVAMAQAAVETIAATWPILLIIAAVAALGVGIYELVTHWHTVWSDVSGFVKQHAAIIAVALAVILGPLGVLIGVALELALHWHLVWDGIKTATHVAWAAMQPVLEFIWKVGLLPIRLAVGLLILEWELAWRAISAATSLAWSLLKPVFGFIVSVGFAGVRAELKTFEVLWTAVWTVVQSVVMQVWDALKPIFEAIQKGIGVVGKGIGFVEGAAGKLGGFAHKAHIPGFAVGTSYAPGGLALVGERGPELMNVPRGARIYPHGTGPGGGGTTINVNIDTAYGNPDDFARAIRDAFLRMQKRTGGLGFAA